MGDGCSDSGGGTSRESRASSSEASSQLDRSKLATRRYNEAMARGWESKSVEAQIEETHSETSINPDQTLSPEERQALIRKRDLTLSRRHVLQQLESSPNERYSELLRRTLAGLDAELAGLV